MRPQRDLCVTVFSRYFNSSPVLKPAETQAHWQAGREANIRLAFLFTNIGTDAQEDRQSESQASRQEGSVTSNEAICHRKWQAGREALATG